MSLSPTDPSGHWSVLRWDTLRWYWMREYVRPGRENDPEETGGEYGKSGLSGVYKTATILTISLNLLEANAFHWVWPLLIVKPGPLRICKPNTTLLGKWLARPFKRVMMRSCNTAWVLNSWQWGPHAEWAFFFLICHSHITIEFYKNHAQCHSVLYPWAFSSLILWHLGGAAGHSTI